MKEQCCQSNPSFILIWPWKQRLRFSRHRKQNILFQNPKHEASFMTSVRKYIDWQWIVKKILKLQKFNEITITMKLSGSVQNFSPYLYWEENKMIGYPQGRIMTFWYPYKCRLVKLWGLLRRRHPLIRPVPVLNIFYSLNKLATNGGHFFLIGFSDSRGSFFNVDFFLLN